MTQKNLIQKNVQDIFFLNMSTLNVKENYFYFTDQSTQTFLTLSRQNNCLSWNHLMQGLHENIRKCNLHKL